MACCASAWCTTVRRRFACTAARPTSTCIAGRPSRTPFCPRRAACSVSSWRRRTARLGLSGSESSRRSRSPASSSAVAVHDPRERAPPVKHLLATVGCLAAIFLVGGLDHLFPSGIWTALGVTLVFVTIGLVIAGALRLLWHGLLRLGVVHHGPPSFRVHGGETDIYLHRWKAFAYTVLPAACGLPGLVLAAKNGAPWAIWLGIVAAFAISGVFLWRYGPSRLLDRTPALVIDAHGIRDPVKGIEVGWDEVQRLVPWEQSLSAGAANRWLGIVPRDEEAVLAHQARSVKLAAGLDKHAQVG